MTDTRTGIDTVGTGVSPAAPPSRASLGWAIVADVVAIGAFVVLGGNTHGGSALHLVGVAVPYLIGWFAAAAAFRLDRQPLSVTRALLVWPFGVACGLALRTVVVGALTRPLALVSFGTLGLLLVGWRLVAAIAARLGAGSRSPDTTA